MARTLFDLLLPNDLKESAPDQDNVVLLLDEESARYPWELLEDGLREGRKPWVIEHGLLRQLESEEFRRTIQSVTENTALVIGDPRSSFVELTGAQAEAEAVWRTLQGSFVAEKRIRPTTLEVVSALFARPYKVLHLAGHGVYRYVPQDAANCEACGQALERHGTAAAASCIGDRHGHRRRRVPHASGSAADAPGSRPRVHQLLLSGPRGRESPRRGADRAAAGVSPPGREHLHRVHPDGRPRRRRGRMGG